MLRSKVKKQRAFFLDALGRRNSRIVDGVGGDVTVYDGFGFDETRSIAVTITGAQVEAVYKKTAEGQSTGKYRYEGLNTSNNQKGLSVAKTRNTLVVNGVPASYKTASGTYYMGQDKQGSIESLTDASGDLIDRYEYDAFGTAIDGDLQVAASFGYAGKKFDPVTRSYDYGFRDYEAAKARFTTVDPIRDGSNWYAYCNADPINCVDLWGLEVTISITNDKVSENGGRITPFVEGQNPDRSSYKEVPTYRMYVTESIKGKVVRTESFEVTRDALYNGRQYQVQPPENTQLYAKFEQESYGPALEIYKEGAFVRDEDAYFTASDNGEKIAGIQIHVGGLYKNPIRDNPGYATSSGCFTLNGSDAGSEGRDRFINTVLAMQYDSKKQGDSDEIQVFVCNSH